jgi:8-oxo-dGTP pyrophosphatase MutT (NUDIX family)
MSHQYEHDDYTHPDVYDPGPAQGWAEKETDPARIDWAERQARAAIPFRVAGGRPVNPGEKTRVRRGRNLMGFWGENLMCDALVLIKEHHGAGASRRLLMVERDDGLGWAVPGGRVEPGEHPVAAAARELGEETGLACGEIRPVELPARYVPDPRASDEAWAVTVPVIFGLGTAGPGGRLPAVQGGDDARRAAWLPAATFGTLAAAVADEYGGRVFAAHVQMLADILGVLAFTSVPGTAGGVRQ